MADTVAGFFSELKAMVDPEKATGMNATYQFDITGDGGGAWHVTFAGGSVVVTEGKAAAPNITLTSDATTWMDIVNGRTSGQTAFLLGKLKIQGDMSLAMKLASVFGFG
ncbi:MAG TPA: SCP2 sterol-binding domain-containing protein [Candidatus Hydrogenedentes bacterium]|jgi:putative sterol carrier protein|nr:SCP2 sterol-binding domain-containing protein [Candidatus Hydrogenedentota bacterium]HPJ98668.1 SCP2 sterol-binding domain-containing protein [Candidatus Hydrogenedentota bacterium]